MCRDLAHKVEAVKPDRAETDRFPHRGVAPARLGIFCCCRAAAGRCTTRALSERNVPDLGETLGNLFLSLRGQRIVALVQLALILEDVRPIACASKCGTRAAERLETMVAERTTDLRDDGVQWRDV
jgi:hypothetical protein